jgi:hypothetical protein
MIAERGSTSRAVTTKARNSEYREWMERFRNLNMRGLCRMQTERMAETFPELRLMRGHYGGSEHWWCVGPDDAIWDPTYLQFSHQCAYVPYFGPDPLGRCMICGALVWSDVGWGGSACSEYCGKELDLEYGL